MSEQLLLDLAPQRLEGFIPASANSKVLQSLIAYEMVAVTGPRLSGKSEIAKATARQLGGQVLTNAEAIDAYLANELACAVCVDDVDEVADERALFHLYNYQKAQGQKLFLFARMAKADWPFALPDLCSRLGTVQETEIGVPDDGLVVALMVKWLYERGLQPRPKMVDYVSKRIERDYAKIYDFVEELDKRVGQTRGKPTRKLAKEILGISS